MQDGDARRFAKVSADDFLRSNPDNSPVERVAFLAQTARPVAIRGVAPGHARVGVLGDGAVI